jgi:DNA polymerase III epsilon subunit family exonuclease
MQKHRNLVSDSPLVQETVDLLCVCGGSATAAEVASLVLNLPEVDAELASMLVADLIKEDHRLRFMDGHKVELACDDAERRLLSESDFVVVDLETTGAKTPPGRIMEIGAYRVEDGRVAAEFQTLVNPEAPIPSFISRLTGITEEMVRTAPLFAEIVADWLDFAGDAVLVAHNSHFDVRVLNHEIGRVFPGRRMINAHLCTVKLSRSCVPGLANYQLSTLAEHFQIPHPNRHRAPADALATAELFIRMLERLSEHGVRDIASARRFRFNEQVSAARSLKPPPLYD